MNEDLRIAFELEAMIVKEHGLVIPGRCDCRLEVLTFYPGQPWFFVKLGCWHSSPTPSLRKMPPNLDAPATVAQVKNHFGWITGLGEPVLLGLLQAAYDQITWPTPSSMVPFVNARDGATINRAGGVFYYKNGTLYYNEPG